MLTAAIVMNEVESNVSREAMAGNVGSHTDNVASLAALEAALR